MEAKPGGWHVRHPRVVDAFEALARVLVAPLVVLRRLRLVRFRAAGELLSLVPGAPGVFLRRAWYGATLAHCGRRLQIGFGATINHADTRVGDHCILASYCRIGHADIGDHFLAAAYVTIPSSGLQHGYGRRDIPMSRQPATLTPVVVGEDVWVGSHATIIADVAAHTIVGAGAVVTGAFAEWSIIGGVPARLLGERPA